MTEDEAYETHFHLAEKIISKSNNIIFKKCDSVLRGHVLTELFALLDVDNKDRILLQPANPITNRCIKNGNYLIDDVLIGNTAFAIDPDFPSKTSSVKNLILDRFNKASQINIHTGNFSEINSKGIFIPDCDSVETLSKCINLYNDKTIISGSAAFFEQFLIKMKLATSKVNQKAHQYSSNYILLSGSTHPKSVQFSKNLEKTNCPLITFPETLIDDNLNEAELNSFIIKLSDIYNNNKKLALRVSNTIIQLKNSALNLKTRMSLVAQKIVEASKTNELFIEGGATAYDLLSELHWNSFTPIEELASGVVRMQYDNNHNKHITIKPGSYEWPKGLLN